jgi:DNA polymerase elongation subunit (family B)
MTGEGLDDKDLVISKLLRQDIQKYKSLFPHVSAAIQLKKYPVKGDIFIGNNHFPKFKTAFCHQENS